VVRAGNAGIIDCVSRCAPAPNFQVTTFDGKKLTLADFKGEVLVINFWATTGRSRPFQQTM
jgi:cytochrome oxidase Cu insertion factor (SCO1/SenC/PrrC family)